MYKCIFGYVNVCIFICTNVCVHLSVYLPIYLSIYIHFYQQLCRVPSKPSESLQNPVQARSKALSDFQAAPPAPSFLNAAARGQTSMTQDSGPRAESSLTTAGSTSTAAGTRWGKHGMARRAYVPMTLEHVSPCFACPASGSLHVARAFRACARYILSEAF